MKKLVLRSTQEPEKKDFFASQFAISHGKREFVLNCKRVLIDCTIEFYEYMGELLQYVGFRNPHVTREGDTNCRMDAIIIDELHSLPIEIKSPREVMEVNVKSIRQALENKIVLLSRKFYHCDAEDTSLVIAYDYPAERSDVYELIEDIYAAWGFNIGIIDLADLLSLAYDVHIKGEIVNLKYFNQYRGKFKYEEAFIK